MFTCIYTRCGQQDRSPRNRSELIITSKATCPEKNAREPEVKPERDGQRCVLSAPISGQSGRQAVAVGGVVGNTTQQT